MNMSVNHSLIKEFQEHIIGDNFLIANRIIQPDSIDGLLVSVIRYNYHFLQRPKSIIIKNDWILNIELSKAHQYKIYLKEEIKQLYTKLGISLKTN